MAYSYDKFLRPISSSDTNIQILGSARFANELGNTDITVRKGSW